MRRPSLQPVGRLVLGANRPVGVEGGIGQGMEMALTVVVFLGIGWFVDAWVDTRPVFTISLVVFAMVGQSVRMWVAYEAKMKVLEEQRRERLAGTSNASIPDNGFDNGHEAGRS